MFNILTFDVEEYFHILELPHPVEQSECSRMPISTEVGLNNFLELLNQHSFTCTFFVLGWLAAKRPYLVRKLSELDHEIASHGYSHELIRDIEPQRFRMDIRRSKKLLEDITGKEVKGYRGPGFSITLKNSWALDIIAEEGYEYDATIFPGHHGHGGIPSMPIRPFIIQTNKGFRLEEYPVTLINIAKYRLAFTGGGYFRLFPSFVINHCCSWLNRRGIPVLSYLHARYLDPNVPRLPMPFFRKFKCYINIAKSIKKLDTLFKKKYFSSIEKWRATNTNRLPVISLENAIKEKYKNQYNR